MMKTKGRGIFGVPGGEVTVDTPDGVTRAYDDGCAPNSLTNSNWARGGPDGGGYGAFRREDSGPMMCWPGESHSGGDVVHVNGKRPTGRFKVG